MDRHGAAEKKTNCIVISLTNMWYKEEIYSIYDYIMSDEQFKNVWNKNQLDVFSMNF